MRPRRSGEISRGNVVSCNQCCSMRNATLDCKCIVPVRMHPSQRCKNWISEQIIYGTSHVKNPIELMHPPANGFRPPVVVISSPPNPGHGNLKSINVLCRYLEQRHQLLRKALVAREECLHLCNIIWRHTLSIRHQQVKCLV